MSATDPTALRPRKGGRVQTRVKQGLRPAEALKGSHDVQRERDEPIVISVEAASRLPGLFCHERASRPPHAVSEVKEFST